jgi:Ca2+-binding EF-hand superfamily protein
VFAHPIFAGAFDHYRINSEKIEDKLKVIMNRLRFKINSENIEMPQLFAALGFAPKAELNFEQFRKLLDFISPKITLEEVRYFFDKVDQDSSGSVSLDEIEAEIGRHLKSGRAGE